MRGWTEAGGSRSRRVWNAPCRKWNGGPCMRRPVNPFEASQRTYLPFRQGNCRQSNRIRVRVATPRHDSKQQPSVLGCRSLRDSPHVSAKAVPAIAALAEVRPTLVDFPTGPILQCQPMGIVEVPTVVPRCRQRCPKPRRVVARSASICREAVDGKSRAKSWRKPKDVYALRRISLREKGFGIVPKALSSSIPDRIRTCNLRLRRPTRYPIVLRGLSTPTSIALAQSLDNRGGEVQKARRRGLGRFGTVA